MARKNKRKRVHEHEGGALSASNPAYQEILPAEPHHYTRIYEIPTKIQHYFRHRYHIWSRYDEGILMTDEAWYGVSQELVAAKVALHTANTTPDSRSVILDAFCGPGANTIAFALSGRWKRVYAIEKDPATLECARHNAEIYGVKDKITWFLGDCFELLGTGENAVDGLRELISQYGVIFGSPPWGGPGYQTDTIFNLDTMQPYSLGYIFQHFSPITSHLVFYLPRTSDLRQIAECTGDEESAQVVHYCTKGHSRALCVYFGSSKKVE